MPGKRLSTDLREKVVKLHGRGLGYKRIADKLVMKKDSVARIVRKYKKFGTVANLPASGRPKITTPRMDHVIISKIQRNPRLPAPKIKLELREEHNVQISAETIKNRIHEAGLKGRAARKKPFHSKAHIAKRLKWAKKYQNWTIQN